jgi:putative SOS response-associated peptidase YedK
MCGRLTNERDLDANAREFAAEPDPASAWSPSYNIAPTQALVVLGARAEQRIVRVVRWGLVPRWASDRKLAASMVNARGETVAERPAFREAFKKRRCAVLATGWFEWRSEGKQKRPHWFHAPGGEILALAGLWERWIDPATGEELRTCAVITTAPNALAATIHDRMPVVLDRAGLDGWLDASASTAQLHALLRACPDDRLAVHPVDRRVGRSAEDDPGLIAPAA